MYLDNSAAAIRGAVGQINFANLQVRPSAPAPHSAPPRFDAGDLYGKGGPTGADIRQDALGDCYFVATLGALANARPDIIKDAIKYDPTTGNFTVTLHDGGKTKSVTVTQADLAYNVQRQGGSTVDNTGADTPVWPAVMETAFAKMKDSNPGNGLKEGFDKIAGGGWADDALETITGSRGTKIEYSKGFFESDDSALGKLGKQIDAALGNGRPLTLSTDPENRSLWEAITGKEGKQDGLVDNHVYMVEGIKKNGNDYTLTLRNPWGTNAGVEGGSVSGPTIQVSLRTLVETGGLESLNAGSAK